MQIEKSGGDDGGVADKMNAHVFLAGKSPFGKKKRCLPYTGAEFSVQTAWGSKAPAAA